MLLSNNSLGFSSETLKRSYPEFRDSQKDSSRMLIIIFLWISKIYIRILPVWSPEIVQHFYQKPSRVFIRNFSINFVRSFSGNLSKTFQDIESLLGILSESIQDSYQLSSGCLFGSLQEIYLNRICSG